MVASREDGGKKPKDEECQTGTHDFGERLVGSIERRGLCFHEGYISGRCWGCGGNVHLLRQARMVLVRRRR